MTRTVQEHRRGKVGPVYTYVVHQAESKRRAGRTGFHSLWHELPERQQKTTKTAGGPPWDMGGPHWACQDRGTRRRICLHAGSSVLLLCHFAHFSYHLQRYSQCSLALLDTEPDTAVSGTWRTRDKRLTRDPSRPLSPTRVRGCCGVKEPHASQQTDSKLLWGQGQCLTC